MLWRDIAKAAVVVAGVVPAAHIVRIDHIARTGHVAAGVAASFALTASAAAGDAAGVVDVPGEAGVAVEVAGAGTDVVLLGLVLVAEVGSGELEGAAGRREECQLRHGLGNRRHHRRLP